MGAVSSGTWNVIGYDRSEDGFKAMTGTSGFEEVAHTADVSLRVWAEDLPTLFAEAAQGMNALAGAQFAAGPAVNRTFRHEAGDRETLLVAFLSELIFLQEQEHLGFRHFRIALGDDSIRVDMEGSSLVALAKPIKAVTFHALKIRETSAGFETQLVFDV